MITAYQTNILQVAGALKESRDIILQRCSGTCLTDEDVKDLDEALHRIEKVFGRLIPLPAAGAKS